ncbi:hypothetical protein OBBRIDRAFT_823255 [Obba rivulosa]|uniref:Homeobox domain-containing protein n=1 Tax=Obba rivulosa TaxID=1052685 RepID=A0A8E2J4X9_9APHY|nr:hypothetical protein OBBRIDRAFT_823255 [Obba rivulosa]
MFRVSTAQSAEERNVLYNIVLGSQKIGHLLSTVKPPSSPISSMTSSNPLNRTLRHFVLPDPKPIIPVLLAANVDDTIAERVSHAYLRAATRLKADCEIRFGRTCRAWLRTCPGYVDWFDILEQKLQTTYMVKYTKTLDAWVTIILEGAMPRACHGGKCLPPSDTRDAPQFCVGRQPFLQDAVLTLDKFFEEEAFPTKLEKERLALETGLDVRQVAVWFQNRRRRRRRRHVFPKGDQLFGSPSIDVAPPHELEMSVQALLKEVASDEGAGIRSIKLDVKESSCLDPLAPPHAFPTAYPPLCDYVPFSVKEAERKFTTSWPRTPSTYRLSDSSHVNIPQLVEAFSKLTIEDKITKTRTTGGGKPVLGFHIKPLPAPLPALVHTVFSGVSQARMDPAGPWSRTQSGHLPPPARRSRRKPLPFSPHLPSRQLLQHAAYTPDPNPPAGSIPAWLELSTKNAIMQQREAKRAPASSYATCEASPKLCHIRELRSPTSYSKFEHHSSSQFGRQVPTATNSSHRDPARSRRRQAREPSDGSILSRSTSRSSSWSSSSTTRSSSASSVSPSELTYSSVSSPSGSDTWSIHPVTPSTTPPTQVSCLPYGDVKSINAGLSAFAATALNFSFQPFQPIEELVGLDAVVNTKRAIRIRSTSPLSNP